MEIKNEIIERILETLLDQIKLINSLKFQADEIKLNDTPVVEVKDGGVMLRSLNPRCFTDDEVEGFKVGEKLMVPALEHFDLGYPITSITPTKEAIDAPPITKPTGATASEDKLTKEHLIDAIIPIKKEDLHPDLIKTLSFTEAIQIIGKKLIEGELTVNQAREMLGYPKLKEGDVYCIHDHKPTPKEYKKSQQEYLKAIQELKRLAKDDHKMFIELCKRRFR